MPRMWVILSILTLFAFPAIAADATKADVATIKKCLASSKSDGHNCIGKIADKCQAGPDGSTTTGIDECLGREETAWDMLLNENYRFATTVAKDQDSSYTEQGIETGAAASLVKAQRAWVAFRDAECDRRFEMHKDGTIRTNIASSCLLDLTAARALDLQSVE